MEIVEFVAKNWEFFLLGFMALEKIVKITPTKWDDIALDMIIKPIFEAIKPGKKKTTVNRPEK